MMTICTVLVLATAVFLVPVAGQAAPRPELIFCCAADNDLYRVMTAGGESYRRFSMPEAAIANAPNGSGVLILADGYPEVRTEMAPTLFDRAAEKQLRLYIEYPAALPGLQIGPPQDVGYKRAVVTSDFFGSSFPPMRIALLSSGRYLPVNVAEPHLVAAKVAGVDTAVFGIEDTAAEPLLFDHPRGNLLVATTKLSHFVTGRYLPSDAWAVIWETIVARVHPDGRRISLEWTPTVRPSYGPADPLPADAERQAVRRAADWIVASRSLRHPSWPREALDWALTYNTVLEKPAPHWPVGDGSLGILEGYSSTIHRDGSQPMRYAVRNDCTTEVAMLLALDAALLGRTENARRAMNLADYIFDQSGLAGGPRADPASPSYGLVGWALDHPGSYWGDDNARAILAVGAVAALGGHRHWDEALARCILANFRTTGVRGFRPSCVTEPQLQARGWNHYWTSRHVHYSPHFQSWLWACNFWVFEQTGFDSLLTRSKTAIRLMMQAYPDRWDWCLRSGTIERSRLLLPLAWLVRVDDTPEHRRWLRTIAEDLLALQHPSGAIREVIGDGGPGIPSNATYGTQETSLIQTDGDTVADMLYSCNFAFIGLHEAAAATGEPFYAAAADRLAEFLCRIQIQSQAHPELDGAWYRAFNFGRWDYWASSADWEWGPWCTETGWAQPWIAGTMALRQQNTSLWDLVQSVDLKTPFVRLRPQMLPDDSLAVDDPVPTVTHSARGAPVLWTMTLDPRYPGFGAASLTDGQLGAADYTNPEWLGFEGRDFEATVDLGAPQTIHTLGANFLQSPQVGVLLPKQVEFAVSSDGERFELVATVRPASLPDPKDTFATTLEAKDLNARGRYVRVRATHFGMLPGRDVPAWLFVDEMMVNRD